MDYESISPMRKKQVSIDHHKWLSPWALGKELNENGQVWARAERVPDTFPLCAMVWEPRLVPGPFSPEQPLSTSPAQC